MSACFLLFTFFSLFDKVCDQVLVVLQIVVTLSVLLSLVVFFPRHHYSDLDLVVKFYLIPRYFSLSYSCGRFWISDFSTAYERRKSHGTECSCCYARLGGLRFYANGSDGAE